MLCSIETYISNTANNLSPKIPGSLKKLVKVALSIVGPTERAAKSRNTLSNIVNSAFFFRETAHTINVEF